MLNHKGSADRVRSAEQVVQVITVQGDALTAGLQQSLGADPGVGPLLAAVRGKLNAASEALATASAAHEAELDDDHGVRAERDARLEAVYEALVDARDGIRGAYGPATLKAMGQAGRLVRRPDRVATAARALLAKAPAVLAAATPRAGFSVDAAAMLAPVEAALPAFEAALTAVDREVREAALTLTERNRAMEAHDAVFGNAASALSALFRLANEPELARRVRPSRRRAGEVAVFDGEPESDAELELPEG